MELLRKLTIICQNRKILDSRNAKNKKDVIINELTDNDYVQIYNNTNGRYVLTEEAKKDNEEV